MNILIPFSIFRANTYALLIALCVVGGVCAVVTIHIECVRAFSSGETLVCKLSMYWNAINISIEKLLDMRECICM